MFRPIFWPSSGTLYLKIILGRSGRNGNLQLFLPQSILRFDTSDDGKKMPKHVVHNALITIWLELWLKVCSSIL